MRALVREVDDGEDDDGPDLVVDVGDPSGVEEIAQERRNSCLAEAPLPVPGHKKNLECSSDAFLLVETGKPSRRKPAAEEVIAKIRAEIPHGKTRKKKPFQIGIPSRTRRGLRSQTLVDSETLTESIEDGAAPKNPSDLGSGSTNQTSPVVLADSALHGDSSSTSHRDAATGGSMGNVDAVESGNAGIVLGIPAILDPKSDGKRCDLFGVCGAAGGSNQGLCTPTVRQNVNMVAGASPDLFDPIAFPTLGSCSGSLSKGSGNGSKHIVGADSVGRQQDASPILSGSTVGDSFAAGEDPAPGRILPPTLLPCPPIILPTGDCLKANISAAKGGKEANTWSSLVSKGQKIDGTPLTFFPPAEEGVAEISEEVLVEGCEIWSNTLIGYVVGKRPYYEYLRINLLKAWKPKGNIKILGLDKGFFLFQFDNQEDRRLVLEDGPWRIGGKPLVIKTFDRFCEFEREEFSTLPVWVRIPNLDPRLWTNAAISRVASCIGKPLSIDSATSSRSRLSFARVCVEVDPFKALPSIVHIRTPYGCFPQPVEYDWKPDPCLDCRSIHHNLGNCPKRIPTTSAPVGGSGQVQSLVPSKAPIQPEKLAWKVIQKKTRPSDPVPPKGKSVDRSNKFSLLADKESIPVKNIQNCSRDSVVGSSPKSRKEKHIVVDQAVAAGNPIDTPSALVPDASTHWGAKPVGHGIGSNSVDRPHLLAEVEGGLGENLGRKGSDSSSREGVGNLMGLRKGFFDAASSYRLSDGLGVAVPPDPRPPV